MLPNKIEVIVDKPSDGEFSEVCAIGNYYDGKGNYCAFEYLGSKLGLMLRLKIMRETDDCDFRAVWLSKA